MTYKLRRRRENFVCDTPLLIVIPSFDDDIPWLIYFKWKSNTIDLWNDEHIHVVRVEINSEHRLLYQWDLLFHHQKINIEDKQHHYPLEKIYSCRSKQQIYWLTNVVDCHLLIWYIKRYKSKNNCCCNQEPD